MAGKSTKKAAAKQIASAGASQRIEKRIAHLEWKGERLAEIAGLSVDALRPGLE